MDAGEDRPGIVHDVSQALAARKVSIEELSTATREAPMTGGMLFEAAATLLAPADLALAERVTGRNGRLGQSNRSMLPTVYTPVRGPYCPDISAARVG